MCLFVRFIACFKQEAEFADRLVRPGRLGVSFGWNGATVIGSLGPGKTEREQKDGGNKGKAKRRTKKIKMTYGTTLKKTGVKS